MNHFISQYEPLFDQEEASAVAEYMNSGGWITEFRKTAEFEKSIAGFVGAKHAVAVNNGTVAISLAAMAAGIEPGDNVLVPDYTMIATPNSLKLFGAEPVFVDVEPATLCIDLAQAEKKLTPAVKGIILVLPNGRYPEAGIEAVINFAKENSLVVIEDAAQGLGSYYPDGKHVGTVGEVGTLSFSTPKIISTGQGGMVLTDDDLIAAKVRKLKDFGRERGGMDIHDVIGYNFKFTDLQAVVGLAQMTKLPERIKRKKFIYSMYAEALGQNSSIELFEHNLELTTPWFIDCLVRDRDALKEYLKANNVGTRDMYPPINAQKAYSASGRFPVAENVGKNGLWLPSHPQLTNEEIDYITAKINNFYSKGA